MSTSIFKTNHTGNGLMAASLTVPAGDCYRLVSVTVKYNVAPTTSQNLTLTLNAHAGASYDTLLYSLDPAAGATTDILWQPDEELFLEGGDAVDAAYTNTDGRTWTVQFTVKKV